MTTRQDIQKPAPGAIIELFELDATAQGAASVYRFVNWANPLGGDVVWRGQTYTRYPVEAEGFELSGRGALPRPKLRVANATGLMGALAIELDDLLGARVTRWRTFVHYLDAVNFPVAPTPTPGVLTFARSTTGTYFGSDGLIKTAAVDTPRIDHDPLTGAVRGLLVEEQRTNRNTYSSGIGGTGYTNRLCSVVANAGPAPDGTTSMTKVVPNSGSAAFPGPYGVNTGIIEGTCTVSVFAKRLDQRYAAVGFHNGSGYNATAVFDLDTGTLVATGWHPTFASSVTGTIIQLAGGIYRLTATVVCLGAVGMYGYCCGGSAYGNPYNRQLTGDGTSGTLFWGMQVEANATASSYIPTTTSAVTRAADYASVTSLAVAARAPSYLAQAATLLSYNDNTTGNVIQFRMEAGGTLKAEVIAGGVTQASLALGTLSAGQQFSAALSYAANDIRGCLDGGTVQSDTSASIPTVDRMMIGRGAGGEWWNSTVLRNRYWSRALTNAELQALTSGGAVADLPAFDMDASTGALEVYTLAPFNPTADPNQYLSRDVWVVDRKSSENRVFIEFELAAPIDVAGVMLPRRQVVANVCAWRYRSAECGYAGGPVADRDDNPTNNPALDACGKRLASCKLRFGQTGVLPYGGFPGTRRIG